jgi:hypothetical protein
MCNRRGRSVPGGQTRSAWPTQSSNYCGVGGASLYSNLDLPVTAWVAALTFAVILRSEATKNLSFCSRVQRDTSLCSK